MKISVIMIDGGFRENLFGAEYFAAQDLPHTDYEIIWVDFYDKVPAAVEQNERVRVIKLNNSADTIYHSSYCFNKGIEEATGELLVIPDADQIVRPDFLSKIWNIHSQFEKLVVYAYRYDEVQQGALKSLSFEELEEKCILKNPVNYGGCLTVRKKWVMAINGYEQHPIFQSGFHANGLDIYTRFKNFGLAVMWTNEVKLYHPWHPFTLTDAPEYVNQRRFIDWRANKLSFMAVNGMKGERNSTSSEFTAGPGSLIQRK